MTGPLSDTAQRELLLAALRANARAQYAARNELDNLALEETRLARKLAAIVEPLVYKCSPARCRVCKRLTPETFGGFPQCAKHAKDQDVARILEQVLYGID